MSTSVSIPLDNMHLYLGGGISINSPIDLNTSITGNPNLPVTALMTGDASKPIATLITGDPSKPLTTTMQGNPDKPVAATIELLNIPRLSLQDIKDLMTPKIRIRIPNYTELCFKLLGSEIFSVCMAGEMQTITEPYVPNAQENCEVQCCQPDTRPFPDQQGNLPGQ
jgi:hypothetical protein